MTPGDHPLRDPLHLLQHAVDPEPDDERVLLRLEVDVAGPVLGRLEDHRVDEPDERRVGDPVVDLEVVAVFLLLLDREPPPRPPRAAPNASDARTSRRISASMSSRAATPISIG